MIQWKAMKTTQSETQSRNLFKSIKDAIPRHCSNCGHKYTDEDLNLIQKDDFNAILHLSCISCKESYLINVVSPSGVLQGSSRVPLKIDITSAKEAKKFFGKKPISSDDILNLHELLKKSSSKELSNLLKSKK